MKNKLLIGVGIIVGITLLGGIFSGFSKSQVAGTQIVATPTPTLTPTPSPTSIPLPTSQNTNSSLSNDNTYVNSNGNTVHAPAYSNTVPQGATAQCGDGTYSFSQHRQGTCSYHKGVAQWLN